MLRGSLVKSVGVRAAACANRRRVPPAPFPTTTTPTPHPHCPRPNPGVCLNLQSAGLKLRMQLVDTVLFKSGRALGHFYTNRDGAVCRFSAHEITRSVRSNGVMEGFSACQFRLSISPLHPCLTARGA